MISHGKSASNLVVIEGKSWSEELSVRKRC
jgi:hypothetical protein